MTLPAAGFVHADLLAQHSQQQPNFAFMDAVPITGTLVVKLGTFAPFGRTIKRTVTACLAQAPVAGAAYVTVAAGPTPDSVTIKVWTSAFAASVTATTVNLIAVIGSSVGQ